MKITTTRFGIIEVENNHMISFPWGIPGFETIKRYVLLEHKDTPFKWLQAVEEPSLAFAVCPPEIIGVQYTVPKEKLEMLEISQPDEALVLTLISFDRDKDIIRCHIKSPIVFALPTKRAYQWTMDTDELKQYVQLPKGMEWPESD